MNRRTTILGGAAAIAAIGVGGYFLNRPQPAPPVKTAEKVSRPTFVFVGHEL